MSDIQETSKYQKIINDHYNGGGSLKWCHEYISQLYFDHRINMTIWWYLHCHILNLGEY
jgi:hypothetical protein